MSEEKKATTIKSLEKVVKQQQIQIEVLLEYLVLSLIVQRTAGAAELVLQLEEYESGWYAEGTGQA